MYLGYLECYDRSGNTEARDAIAAKPTYNVAWEALPLLFEATGGKLSNTDDIDVFEVTPATLQLSSPKITDKSPPSARSSASEELTQPTVSKPVLGRREGWRKQWGWCTGADLDKWWGVTIGHGAHSTLHTGRVTGLGLQSNGLTGAW